MAHTTYMYGSPRLVLFLTHVAGAYDDASMKLHHVWLSLIFGCLARFGETAGIS